MITRESDVVQLGAAARSGRAKTALQRLVSGAGIWMIVVLLAAALAFTSPHFLTQRNIINVLRQISVNGLLAIGMTFVILTGGIDLSVGSVLAFGGIVGASLASPAVGNVYPLYVSLTLALLSGAALGLVNGLLVARWRVPPFVATLGMLSMARGLTYIYSNGMPVPRITPGLLYLGQGTILGIPMPVVILGGVFALAWFVLYRTKFGRYVYAVGGNEEAAVVSGVDVRSVKTAVYVISGILAALGGVILVGRTTAGLPQAGVAYELDAIAAVVIGGASLNGGRGTLAGTIAGALIIGIVSNGLDLLRVSAYYQQVFKGAIIIAAVLLDVIRRRSD